MTLEEARQLAGLTKDELETKAGVSRSTVYDIEAGRNTRPRHETVVRIVHALQHAGLPRITSQSINEFAVDLSIKEIVKETVTVKELQP